MKLRIWQVGLVLSLVGGLATPTQAALVAHYEFEGDLQDSAGTNHGTGHSGPTFAPGMIGQAASFDGTNSRVEIPHDASLDLSGAMTLAAWIHPLSIPQNGNSGVLFKGDLGSPGQGPWDLFIVDVGAEVGISINDGAAQAREIGALVLEDWAHVAATYDGLELKLYLDGELAVTTPFAGSIDQEISPLNIGQRFATNFNTFDGLIDDVRVYDHALSETEIQTLLPEPGASMSLLLGGALLAALASRAGTRGTRHGDT